MVSFSYVTAKNVSNIGRFSLARSQWAHETKICPAGLKARKNLKISVTFSARKKKKKDSIFLKKFFENKFFTDMEIYQKKTNWRVRGTLTWDGEKEKDNSKLVPICMMKGFFCIGANYVL